MFHGELNFSLCTSRPTPEPLHPKLSARADERSTDCGLEALGGCREGGSFPGDFRFLAMCSFSSLASAPMRGMLPGGT